MATIDSSLYTVTSLRGKVSHVCDGDTLDVDIPSGFFGTKIETLRIRYAGMDTPELAKKHPQTLQESVAEPYAEAAKTYVEQKVLHKTVTVDVARMKGSKDLIRGVRGRVVGVVHHSIFGPSMNVELVKKGFARVHPRASCTWMTSTLWRQLQSAEKHAKRKHLRIWMVAPKPSSIWPLILGIGIGFVLCIFGLLFLVS